MTFINSSSLLLLLLIVVSGISRNMTVCYAAICLLIIRFTPLTHFFPWFEKNGLNIGVIVLTIAVLVPIASNKFSLQQIIDSFSSFKSVLAVLIGIVVSWLGSRGITLITQEPTIVMGLIVGTLIGVAVFRGIPAGPLIAAGLLSLLIGKS